MQRPAPNCPLANPADQRTATYLFQHACIQLALCRQGGARGGGCLQAAAGRSRPRLPRRRSSPPPREQKSLSPSQPDPPGASAYAAAPPAGVTRGRPSAAGGKPNPLGTLPHGACIVAPAQCLVSRVPPAALQGSPQRACRIQTSSSARSRFSKADFEDIVTRFEDEAGAAAKAAQTRDAGGGLD